MSTIPRIESFAAEFVRIRQDLHAYPELGFEETRTSQIVADHLASWGIEVHRGLARTGVIGVIQGNRGNCPMIGLRADMDALPMEEQASVAYRSRVNGKFHGCGHHGHTATLLAAARYLVETRDFLGTTVLIFQPAEEGRGGGRAMLKDGLFDMFPCDAIFGFHNWPDLDPGVVQILKGPIMAGADFFDITLSGQGSHAGMPHQGNDTIVATGQLISALQSIVARRIDPLEPGLLSITRIEGGSSYNVLPSVSRVAGTLRFLSEDIRQFLDANLRQVTRGIAEALGVHTQIEIRNAFPITCNASGPADLVAAVAKEIVRSDAVLTNGKPTMGSEDFGDMLQQVPGAYFFIGQRNSVPLHHPEYVFDDDVIPIAASILVRVVENAGVPPHLG